MARLQGFERRYRGITQKNAYLNGNGGKPPGELTANIGSNRKSVTTELPVMSVTVYPERIWADESPEPDLAYYPGLDEQYDYTSGTYGQIVHPACKVTYTGEDGSSKAISYVDSLSFYSKNSETNDVNTYYHSYQKWYDVDIRDALGHSTNYGNYMYDAEKRTLAEGSYPPCTIRAKKNTNVTVEICIYFEYSNNKCSRRYSPHYIYLYDKNGTRFGGDYLAGDEPYVWMNTSTIVDRDKTIQPRLTYLGSEDVTSGFNAKNAAKYRYDLAES